MDINTLFAQLVSGLSVAMLIFLVASGLTLIFGVVNVFNFAHGSFYLLGTYFAYQTVQMSGNFWTGLIHRRHRRRDCWHADGIPVLKKDLREGRGRALPDPPHLFLYSHPRRRGEIHLGLGVQNHTQTRVPRGLGEPGARRGPFVQYLHYCRGPGCGALRLVLPDENGYGQKGEGLFPRQEHARPSGDQCSPHHDGGLRRCHRYGRSCGRHGGSA